MTSDDITAVRDALQQAYVAWAAGDADAFATLYTDDVTVVIRGVFSIRPASVLG